MAQLTKDSGTSIGTNFSTTSCSNCPRIATSESASTPEHNRETPLIDLVIKSLVTMDKLQKDIMKVEKEQDRTFGFYKGIEKLTHTSRIAITVLMIIPAFQLIACTAIVYYLGIQERLSGLLTWILGGVSIFSVVEILITALKYTMLESKVSELEKKVEKFADTIQ